MTTLGQVVSTSCRSFSLVQPSPFLSWLVGLFSEQSAVRIFASTVSPGVHVVAKACPPGFGMYVPPIVHPMSTTLEFEQEDLTVSWNAGDPTTFVDGDDVGDEEYDARDDTVRVVVMDQLWTHEVLGDRRIDLNIVKKDVTQGDSSIEAWLIAPDIPQLKPFLVAAERSGWRVCTIPSGPPRERGLDLDRALGEILSRLDLGAVLLISNYADMIASIENLGWEVILETDIEPFVV